MRDYQERLDSDPNRLEAIESRLETLAGLKRKYGQTLPAVQAFLEAAQRDLAALDSAQEDEQQLAAQAWSLRDKMAGLAQALSAARAQGSEELRQAVQLELEELGM